MVKGVGFCLGMLFFLVTADPVIYTSRQKHVGDTKNLAINNEGLTYHKRQNIVNGTRRNASGAGRQTTTHVAAFAVTSDPTGAYKINVGGSAWLTSAPTFITVGGKQYSTADKTLKLQTYYQTSGIDKLGAWTETFWNYTTGDTTTAYFSSIRTYTELNNVAIFTQAFPFGAKGCSIGDANKISTGFPNFSLKDQPGLGYLSFGGYHAGWRNLSLGKLTNFTGVHGIEGGPIALFNKAGATLVISPFNKFMAASNCYSSENGGSFAWGIMGKAELIPNTYQLSTVVYFDSGINKAFEGWGCLLRHYYDKDSSRLKSDLTVNYLGYWTDNGAYYYYHTVPNTTYEQTLLQVEAYAKTNKIPYRYFEYDSWFYYKGANDGVKTWDAMPEVFPGGLKGVFDNTSLPVTAHNRWWSPETTYARQNGGNFDFIVEKKAALPMHQDFWEYLFSESIKWGLYTYEQDWLNVQFESMDSMFTDIEQGHQWLMEMGNAAEKYGVKVQYCMAFARHLMQSLEIPAVTQIRVSEDYLYLDYQQWQIGISSIFAHAMGVAPFKDNFWSSKEQPDNIYNKTEPYPALQAAVAVLSTGPVAPSDKIAQSNISLIMRCCDMDGLILKPSRPLTAIDSQILQEAFQDGSGQSGQVWSTVSEVAGFPFGIILVANLTSNLEIGPTKAGFTSPQLAKAKVIRDNWGQEPDWMWDFSDDKPLTLSPQNCSLDNFCVLYVMPVLKYGKQEVLLFGELERWVPMSPERVTDIYMGNSFIRINLKGAPGEVVDFWILHGPLLTDILCTMSESGKAILYLEGVDDLQCVPDV